MAAIINGIPVNFGFTGTNGITITGLSGLLLQTVDQAAHADLESVRDGNGAEAMHGWHNQYLEATLEFVITGTGIANAITNTTVTGLTPGSFITITACASVPDLATVSLQIWEVQSGAKITGSNTTVKKMSVPIRRYAGITAVAAA